MKPHSSRGMICDNNKLFNSFHNKWIQCSKVHQLTLTTRCYVCTCNSRLKSVGQGENVANKLKTQL